MSELKKLEEQLRAVQIAKIRNTNADKTYFEQMSEEVELLKRIAELTPTKPLKEVQAITLWSESEVADLREWYATNTANQIALALGRTVDAVESKVKLLGLSKT